MVAVRKHPGANPGDAANFGKSSFGRPMAKQKPDDMIIAA
jgi:hypothetical protein